jgi:hypothetical protein
MVRFGPWIQAHQSNLGLRCGCREAREALLRVLRDTLGWRLPACESRALLSVLERGRSVLTRRVGQKTDGRRRGHGRRAVARVAWQQSSRPLGIAKAFAAGDLAHVDVSAIEDDGTVTH